jgi:hypothetical protein
MTTSIMQAQKQALCTQSFGSLGIFLPANSSISFLPDHIHV